MSDDPRDSTAATRELLRAAGAVEDAPPVDIARDAVARLRGRKRATGNVNEFFRLFQHFLAGISKILGSPPIDDDRRKTPE
jgi:hypothetical protein